MDRFPLQRYRFFCRITETCVDGRWVVTQREFVGDRIGTAEWASSTTFHVEDPRSDAERAWRTLSAPFTRKNTTAEGQIAAAQRACAG